MKRAVLALLLLVTPAGAQPVTFVDTILAKMPAGMTMPAACGPRVGAVDLCKYISLVAADAVAATIMPAGVRATLSTPFDAERTDDDVRVPARVSGAEAQTIFENPCRCCASCGATSRST